MSKNIILRHSVTPEAAKTCFLAPILKALRLCIWCFINANIVMKQKTGHVNNKNRYVYQQEVYNCMFFYIEYLNLSGFRECWRGKNVHMNASSCSVWTYKAQTLKDSICSAFPYGDVNLCSLYYSQFHLYNNQCLIIMQPLALHLVDFHWIMITNKRASLLRRLSGHWKATPMCVSVC